jgi:hypothetical protein
MRNNARFFVSPRHFLRLAKGEVNNIIEIGFLDHGVPSSANIDENDVSCSFRGIELEQVSIADLDVAENVNKFAYETLTGTNRNIIKLAVDALEIDTSNKARKHIVGLLVDYILEDLVYANNAQNPLYTFRALLSDGTLVSLSEACTMDTVRRKMDALDRDAAINRIGFYKYEITRAVIRK